MPDATITSTASTFGTISGTFAADQSTIAGTITAITGTVNGSVGVPGPQGPQGVQGIQGIQGDPGAPGQGVAAGGSAGQVLQKLSATSYDTGWLTLPADYITSVTAPLAVASGNLSVNLSAYLPLAGGTITGDILSYNGSRFQTIASGSGSTYSLVASDGVVVSGGGVGGNQISIQWDGITFADGKQTVKYPGAATLFDNAALTGNPTAPTPATSDNDTSIATTAFVKAQGYLTSAPVTSVAGRTGAITLSNTDISGLGTLAVVNDAPSDGSQYARKNAAWDVVIPGDRYLTSSTTSLTIDNANKTLTIGTGLSYTPTQNITISYDASNHMHGEVLTYNSGTGVLTVDVNNHTGSGTYASWVVNVGGVTPATSVAWGDVTGTLSAQTDLQNALDLKLDATTAASTYYLQTNPDGFITSAALSGYATETFVTSQGYVTQSTTDGLYYGISNPEGFITSLALTPYATLASPSLTGNVTITSNSGSPALVITQDGAGDIIQFKDVTSDTTYSFIDANGKVGTVAATTTNAGFNVAHGVAPTSPVNGDVWTTTSGLFARINAGTRQFATLSDGQSFSGNNTFTGPTLTFGNTTATSTVNIASGATVNASTKTVNIMTSGATGSSSSMLIGPLAGASTIEIGPCTVASSLNLAVGAVASGSTKNISIGTGGVLGTTNINIGSTSGTTINVNGATTFTGATQTLGNNAGNTTVGVASGATTATFAKTLNLGTGGLASSTTTINIGSAVAGTSTTTLNGTTNGVTAAVDTNSVALATTAYVVGQAGSATPLVNGTAAVGTSLRYARQDHVHGTDTTRAPLASPTFTGTPLSTTAAVDTNTTQIATTAYVIGQGYLKSDTAVSTYQTLAGMSSYLTSATAASTYFTIANAANKADLNSPSFTGTPSLPTGTIGVTQTPGNNTTALATTAFVTAAVPAFATVEQAALNSSATTVISPANSRVAGLTTNVWAGTASGLSSIVLGTGANIGSGYSILNGRLLAPLALTLGYASRGFTLQYGSNAGNAAVNYGTASGHAVRVYTQQWPNTVAGVKMRGIFGRRGGSLPAPAPLAERGYGWEWDFSTRTMRILAHNGTTLTNPSVTWNPSVGRTYEIMVTSSGTGTISLYIDNTLMGTTTGGPNDLIGNSAPVWWQTEIQNEVTAGGQLDFYFQNPKVYNTNG